jgi:outer membrane protein OmpA-like peptidoglycan-associated protein/tetratricopeptide (TPR) repeat protein
LILQYKKPRSTHMQCNKLIILFIFFFLPLILFGQNLSTTSKKATKRYEEAMNNMQTHNYNEVIILLDEALSEDKNYTEAWLLKADAFEMLKQYDKVAESCSMALNVGGEKYPVSYFFCAQAYFKIGKYSEALEMATTFINKKQSTPKQSAEAEKLVRNCQFAIQALKNPVPFVPDNLSNNINSKYDEYWPSLSADEEILTFTRLVPKNYNNTDIYNNRQEDIYYSTLIDGTWNEARNIGNTINTPYNEGSEFITSDGLKMYFTACNRPDSKGKCDIYFAEKTNEGWSEAINVGEPVNTGSNEKQPSLSADGRTIYFVSNRTGSFGSYDIWASNMNENGKWTEPYNLGDSINTIDDEQSPFIHPDGQTLYFTSDGWVGMGGYDIFLSRKKGVNQWTTSFNLGYPINTNADETGLVVNAKGNHAYFASDRIPEKGKDIFDFELYDAAKPVLVSYMKGKVFDAENNKPLDAKFELIDLKSQNIVNQSVASRYNGEFLVCLPTNHDYALNVSKEGYLFYSENFTFIGINDKSKPLLKNIAMQPIKQGNIVVLNNIFFETGSFALKQESTVELNKLLQFMQNNKEIKIEIRGHTDNIGDKNSNIKLSENRAKSVYDFLIQKGINMERMKYKGFGETSPVENNTTEEGRAKNRRTEFAIID